MKRLLTICARGGSKGIPGKNIKKINDKPLIYYTIKIGEEFKKINPETDIYLSTDSKEIEEVVKEISSVVMTDYKRPDRLAKDNSGKISAIADVLNYAENKSKVFYEEIIDLDVTSPLRNYLDLENALKILKSEEEALNIFSVSPANRNPYFNMIERTNGNKFVKLSKEGSFLTRQSAPEVYDMNGSFYIYRSEFFKKNIQHPVTEKSLIYIMPHICFDLDHSIDFTFMEYLLKENKLDFEFG